MNQKQFAHNLYTPLLLNREDTDAGRFYVLPDGTKAPSVTTVLGWEKKEGLIEWRKRVGEEEANRISTKAANRGTKLHSIIEDYLNNKQIDFKSLDIGTIDLFTSVKEYLDDIEEVYGIEVPLFSKHLGVAGTVDCVAKFRNKRFILDWKTSNRPKKIEWIDGYFMQTACYAVMYEECTGNPITNLGVLIAVDNDSPQFFQQKRDRWIDKAINIINSYYDYHGLKRNGRTI